MNRLKLDPYHRGILVEAARDLSRPLIRSMDVAERGACLAFAAGTAVALHETFGVLGVRVLIQAGSMHWPRMDPEQDDGKETTMTHFSYTFEPRAAMMKLMERQLPEMHCWVGLVHPDGYNEIVDLTTKYLPVQCRECSRMEWTGKPPPDYLWAGTEDWPDERVVYEPDRNACVMAAQLLRAEFPQLNHRL